MNQISSVTSFDQTAFFFPKDGATYVADIQKLADKTMLVRFDYGQLTTPLTGIASFSFQVDIGSNPPLMVTGANVNVAPVEAYEGLDFLLSGGVPGTRYILSVTVTGVQETRTDELIVNVPLEECGCALPPAGIINSATYPTGEGQIYINDRPKYIVSETAPTGVNLMDQWYNPAVNALYQYVTDGTQYWWQQMVATAPPGPTTFQTLHLAPLPVDGHTMGFSLQTNGMGPVNVLASTDLIVSVDGVVQEPEAQFVAGGNTIQFVTAPSADSKVFIVWFEH